MGILSEARRRYAVDGVEDMSEEERMEWVNRLPLFQFIAFMLFGPAKCEDCHQPEDWCICSLERPKGV